MKIFILWLHLPCSFSCFRQPFHFTLHLLHSSNKCSYNSTFWQKDLMAALACISPTLPLLSAIIWSLIYLERRPEKLKMSMFHHCLLNVRCCRSWAGIVSNTSEASRSETWSRCRSASPCLLSGMASGGELHSLPCDWKIAATVCSLVLSQMQSASELHAVDQIWLFYKTKMATNTKLEATKCQWVMSRWVYHPVHPPRAP